MCNPTVYMTRVFVIINFVMLSLAISSFSALKNRIIEGMQTPISECISEDEVKW